MSAINLVYHCTHSKKVVADGPDGPARTPAGTEARVTSRLADRITCGPRRLFVSPQLCTRASKNTHTNCATSVRFLDTEAESAPRQSHAPANEPAAAVHLLFMAAATEP